MKFNPFAAASAAIALSLALAGAAEAATIRVVALTGQEAPGTGGEAFTGFVGPALNDAGETAFIGTFTGANGVGIFASGALVAREGDVAPGAGGATFTGFGIPALNNAGETAFRGFLAGAGVTGANDSGIFTPGALVAREGDAAPGAGGATFSSFVNDPALNDAGVTAFSGFLIGAGVDAANDGGIFTSGALAAREGDAAPGAGGATFRRFGDPALNNAGETAFVADLTGAGVTSLNNNGIFTSGALVVREGDPAPGAGGAVFSSFGNPALNNAGETAFVGVLTGAGVTLFANDVGVFTSGALVARRGDAAPGAGAATFTGFGNPALNDAGETAFVGSLTGAGVDSANDSGIFATSGGVLDLILRTGDLLDIGGGDLRTLTLLSFLPGGFNNNGDIAFRAFFSAGAGGAAGSGIFVYEAGSVSAAVPLPPALGLMLFGVAALGFAGRRRARG